MKSPPQWRRCRELDGGSGDPCSVPGIPSPRVSPLMARRSKTSMDVYSPSHVAQKTDFLDFLHEYCEEKSETFTEF